ncbi:hypothetical protein [Actinoplanes aureus]|jgi:hypothetical protein|uniref:Uncharacterized protein n=1 Tax=Actinoplanes aureus TaxID=2792083 RepID=A0A931CDU8_9ACTN|nr:hypothetical protein [Actinoplanes aureus]MBG0564333.1 hypothetical protein [Actinoplanes aureus]
MPEFSEHCDPIDALDFRADETRPAGYLLDLAVGDTIVPAGLKVAVPTDVTAEPSPGAGVRLTPAVAVLGSLSWSTVPGDPIRIFAYAEIGVAQTLAALRQSGRADVLVRVAVAIYEYDPGMRAYFTRFRTHAGAAPPGAPPGSPMDPAAPATPVYGRLGRDGLLVARDPEDLTPGVRAHALQFELLPVPAAGPQQILLQTSPTTKVVKPFGLPQT